MPARQFWGKPLGLLFLAVPRVLLLLFLMWQLLLGLLACWQVFSLHPLVHLVVCCPLRMALGLLILSLRGRVSSLVALGVHLTLCTSISALRALLPLGPVTLKPLWLLLLLLGLWGPRVFLPLLPALFEKSRLCPRHLVAVCLC